MAEEPSEAPRPRKPLYWCGSSYRDYRALPGAVQDDAGFQLDLVQQGLDPLTFSPERAIGHGVLKLILQDRGGTYRVFYVAKFEEAVYVLHAFQKKARRGIGTPRGDLDLVRQRLRDVEAHRPGRRRDPAGG